MMCRIASFMLAAFLAMGLAGCDFDLEEGDPDIIETDEPDSRTIIDNDRPGVDVNVDDDPDIAAPGVDVEVDNDTPDTVVVPDVEVTPPDAAGEGTTPTDPEG
jgi:hypothetical protein